MLDLGRLLLKLNTDALLTEDFDLDGFDRITRQVSQAFIALHHHPPTGGGYTHGFFLPEDYAKLILRSEPDFVEAKGYSWIGGL